MIGLPCEIRKIEPWFKQQNSIRQSLINPTSWQVKAFFQPKTVNQDLDSYH